MAGHGRLRVWGITLTKRVLSAIAALSMMALAFLVGAAHAQSCAGPDCRRGAPLVVVEGTDVAKAPASNGILSRSSASSSAALVAASLGGMLVAIVLATIGFRRWQALNEPALRPDDAGSTARAAGRTERLDEVAADRRSAVGSSYA